MSAACRPALQLLRHVRSGADRSAETVYHPSSGAPEPLHRSDSGGGSRAGADHLPQREFDALPAEPEPDHLSVRAEDSERPLQRLSCAEVRKPERVEKSVEDPERRGGSRTGQCGTSDESERETIFPAPSCGHAPVLLRDPEVVLPRDSNPPEETGGPGSDDRQQSLDARPAGFRAECAAGLYGPSQLLVAPDRLGQLASGEYSLCAESDDSQSGRGSDRHACRAPHPRETLHRNGVERRFDQRIPCGRPDSGPRLRLAAQLEHLPVHLLHAAEGRDLPPADHLFVRNRRRSAPASALSGHHADVPPRRHPAGLRRIRPLHHTARTGRSHLLSGSGRCPQSIVPHEGGSPVRRGETEPLTAAQHGAGSGQRNRGTVLEQQDRTGEDRHAVHTGICRIPGIRSGDCPARHAVPAENRLCRPGSDQLRRKADQELATSSSGGRRPRLEQGDEIQLPAKPDRQGGNASDHSAAG